LPNHSRIPLLLAVIGSALVLLAVPSAVGQSLYDQQDRVNEKIAGLRDSINEAKHREGALTGDIAAAGAEIESLEGDIAVLGEQIAVLEAELAEHRARLEELKALFAEQTDDYFHLRRQYKIAEQQLEERLVDLYQEGDEGALAILMQVQSLDELIDQLEYFDDVGRQDRAISQEIKHFRDEMRVARERTRRTKAKVADATAVLADKTNEAIAAQNALVARQEALAAARAEEQAMLAGVRDERHAAEEDLSAMEAASASLASEIQAAEAAAEAEAARSSSGGSSGGGGGGSSAGVVSSSGFMWPTSGVVTSGFGYRWGRLHAGVDIAAPYGTGVVAAASGTVIYAGGMGGYGNIVVISHGNGLATAYAHLSSIYVGGGSVSQGQSIGAVGCTGSCTGNHLHFEVRVNGSPVDPMGYL
jgi:murein DD-endopeptidase MepM/ murein hydrolase activator NlpD